MANLKEKKYFVVGTVATVLTILAIGFYFTWVYMSSSEHHADVAFTSFDNIVVTSQTYSIRTSISVQTSEENKIWIKKNKASLERVLKTSLENTDPEIALGANGLQSLQDSLKEESNRTLQTTVIQNVLFTDFVLVMNDRQ